MDREEKFVSHSIDVDTPTVARMYDWFLGGIDNYPADQQACGGLIEIAPSSRAVVRSGRHFLERAVRLLAQNLGVRQFLNFGFGLPVQDNVHQIVQRIDRSARVVYADSDPMVLAHGRAVLEENDQTAVVGADITDVEAVFTRDDVTRLINPDQPTAVLLVSVLNLVSDAADPAELIRQVVRHLAPGSLLVMSQLVSDSEEFGRQATEYMLACTAGRWGRVRKRAEVELFFAGLELLPPGLVDVSDWRPDSDIRPRARSAEWVEYGGIARVC